MKNLLSKVESLLLFALAATVVAVAPACTRLGESANPSQKPAAQARSPGSPSPAAIDSVPATQATATVEVHPHSAPPTWTITPTITFTPAPTATSTPLACWQQGGRLSDHSLRTERLPLPLEYRLYLPPCYDQQPDRRYPVLYLIHGQNYDHDQWDRLGADEAADRLIASGEIPPLIIVFPRDRSWAQPTEDMFGQVIADELAPAIDGQYRAIPDRRYRAIAGLSRGAGWAVHLGLSRWELFGVIGAHSLPVFWADTSHIRGWLDAIPPEDLPRIYLDIGEKDRPAILASAMWFENLLNERDIPHEWYLFTGYHEESYWEAHMEQYLRWYTREW